MTANQRRPGFRLPWSSEMDEQASEGAPGADAQRAEATAEGTTAEPGAAPVTEATTEQPAPAGEGAPEATAGAEPQAQAAEQSEASSEDGKPESPAPSAAAPTAPTVQAGAEPPTDEFMRDLVAAMRKVADEARDSGVQELKAKADEYVRRLEGDAERRREELRNRTEKDVAEVGEWAKAEAERITQEADQRVAARRSQLEQQLASEGQRTEAETTAVRERVAEYERELDAYYDQLLQINDPAAFAAAAKRMPKAPSLTPSAKAAQPPAAQSPATPTEGVTNVAAAQLAETAPAETAPAETAPAAAQDPGAPVEPVEPAPNNGVPQDAAQVHPAEEEVLAARLAQLDATLPAAEAGGGPAAGGQPGAAGSAEQATTEVVVKGLGSFGAITGFRQSLSGVEGIDGVALSLGQTGEFVFRATHAAGFDVRGAIARLEGDGAKIEERPEGGLRVTLERAR